MNFKGKVSSKRWEIAQEAEKEFWQNKYPGEVMQIELGDKYFKKSKILLKKWSKFIKINKKTKILQIGCGPLDLINYLKGMKRYSLDPLADFYKEKFPVDYKKANLVKGVGEDLPFKDEFFDIVLLPNVLDHTVNPEKVLSEIKRVLKKDGIFYFDIYFYQKGFLQLARAWAFSKKFKKKIFNPAHPHMFTLKKVKSLLSKDFSILFEEVGRDIGVYENISKLKQQRKNQKLTKKLPACFGLLGEINYTAICKKHT